MRKTQQTKVANTAYIEAMRELRRSGASGVHKDKRDRRARTRKAANLKAVREEQAND